MPSMLHDAFASTQLDEPDLPSLSATAYRTSALSPAYLVNPLTPPSRPTLRHTASSNANLETTATANRLRSGSLTQVTAAAFGTSDFSNAWLANPAPARSPLGKEIDDPLNAYTSPSDSAASLITDDLNFSTLDYLGLANDTDLPPASMSDARTQAQRAIANYGPASRLRASTISNVNRPLRPSVTNDNVYGEEEVLAKTIAELGMYDTSYSPYNNTLPNLYGSQYSSSSFKENRPRATTIGALDNPLRRTGLTSRNPYLSSIPQSPTYGYQSNPNAVYGGHPPNTRDSSRGPRLSISSHTSRAGTPDNLGGGATPQVPTRSLWIGNLDVDATSEGLLHVFAPYGAIESVRMLPEKASGRSIVVETKLIIADLRFRQLHGTTRRYPSSR
jgi:protein JSN1